MAERVFVTDTVQTTPHVVMVRPRRFGQNQQTAASNRFQRPPDTATEAVRTAARAEFDRMAEQLRAAGIDVLVFDDAAAPAKPDAVFPNNWISTHANGDVYLYPLEAPNRRPERRPDIVSALFERHGFAVARVVDLSAAERRGLFLESTGSMALDRVNGVAYAARSSRTHEPVLAEFCRESGYEARPFDTADAAGRPVYHTNIMLAIGRRFAVICAEIITDRNQRERILDALRATGRELLTITAAQMHAFAGNLLELASAAGEPVIALSSAAWAALDADQRERLAARGRVLPVDIATIERVGGGSVRCMLAEIFLPRAAGDTRDEHHGV